MILNSGRCGTSLQSVSRGPDMARANAAGVAAHAGAQPELARTAELHAPALGQAATGFKSLEIWVRRGVPAMVALFIGALVATTAAMSRNSYDRAVSDALTDLELLAAVVADDLRDTLKQTPGDIEATLADAVPSRALARGEQVLVTNLAGDIVAAAPSALGVKGSLTDYLGAAQPLTIFAEKAGVLRINLGNGADALATVRTLRGPFGQVAIVYPMTAVVAEWRANAFRTAILLGLSALVLVALAFAYFWQASRARELRPRLRARARTHRHRAQPRPMRALGLGSRARPDLLVGSRCIRSSG